MVRTSTATTAATAALAVAMTSAPAFGEGGLRKGPWLMNLRPGGVTVMLEREAPGPVHIRLRPVGAPDAGAPDAAVGGEPAPVEVDAHAAVTLHEVDVAGLAPGVRYRYEVTGPGLAPTGGTFATAPDGPVPFRFVIYGDTRTNEGVHAAAVRAIAAEGAEFVVHTGDLMTDGRQEVQWQRFFEIERDLLRTTPFVPVIGNHEIQAPTSAGVDNYRRYVNCAPGSPEPELDYTLAFGSVRLILANAYDDWTLPSMRIWLAGELARARREVPDGFVIVAMHWGLCSSGPHGENRRMRAAGIDELFRQHGVDLVVSGHDHAYERGEDNGLRYLVTGGGGAPVYRARGVRPYTRAFAAEHHYVRADVEPGLLTLTAVRLDGTVIERCGLRRTGWDCPQMPNLTAAAMAEPPSAGGGGSTPRQRANACGCRVPGGGAPAGAAGALLVAAWVAITRRRRRAGA